MSNCGLAKTDDKVLAAISLAMEQNQLAQVAVVALSDAKASSNLCRRLASRFQRANREALLVETLVDCHGGQQWHFDDISCHQAIEEHSSFDRLPSCSHQQHPVTREDLEHALLRLHQEYPVIVGDVGTLHSPDAEAFIAGFGAVVLVVSAGVDEEHSINEAMQMFHCFELPVLAVVMEHGSTPRLGKQLGGSLRRRGWSKKMADWCENCKWMNGLHSSLG